MRDGRAGDYPDASREDTAVGFPRAGRSPFRIVRIAAGFLLLFLGVIGLFLPVLQGVLMILGGLALLSRDLPWARAVTDRLAAVLRRRRARSSKRNGSRREGR